MASTLIQAGAVVTLDPQGRIHRPGYVKIRDGRITDVSPGVVPKSNGAERVINLSDRLIMPGLVNAHTHTPMVLFRGLTEGHSLLTFEGWYKAVRVWEEVLDPELLPPAVAVSCAEMIRTGTTCFADQYFSMDKVLPVVRRSRMRAALAYGIVEMGDAAARARELSAAEAFLDSIQGHDRLSGWIGPHAFFVDNSPEAILLELELADRYSTGLHIHLATSGEEDRYCQEHYGRSAVQQMQQMGVLDRRLMAAHCLTLPEPDFPALAAADFSAVICASACMRSGAPAAPVRAMLDAGLNLALGTDNVTNNNSYDLFKEMQLVAKLASYREGRPQIVTAQEVVNMATKGGARALGLEDEIGSLEPGKQADLIALDLNEVGWAPGSGQDVYTALVYAVGGMHVTDVMVGGEWLYQDRSWTTLDYAGAVAQLEDAVGRLRNLREAG